MPWYCASILTLVKCHLLACVQVPLCHVAAKQALVMTVLMRPHPVLANGRMLCKTAGIRIARRSIRDLQVDDIQFFLCRVAALGTLKSHLRPAITRPYGSMISWSVGAYTKLKVRYQFQYSLDTVVTWCTGAAQLTDGPDNELRCDTWI